MTRHWVAVASADHVRRGRAGGFMQVCHGKAAPLRRIAPGDRVVYYSPTVAFRGTDTLRAFTALGIIAGGAPYQFDLGEGFCPFRRDVSWLPAEEAPIAPLLDRLSFTAGRTSWGYKFRFGLFDIAEDDMQIIAEAMGIAHRDITLTAAEHAAQPIATVR